MVNEFPSTACVGIDGSSGCGFGRVGVELQELMQNLALRTATGFTQDTNIQHLSNPVQIVSTPSPPPHHNRHTFDHKHTQHIT